MRFNRKGLVLLPLLWFIVAGVVTLAEFAYMAYDIGSRVVSFGDVGSGESWNNNR